MKYIEKLLKGAEVKWMPLGEVAEIKTGQGVSKNLIAENPGVFPVINSGREPLGLINVWNTDNDPIGITSRGAGVGSVTWQEGKYFRGNLNYSVSIKDDSKVNTRYIYYLLLHMQINIHALCTFQGIPALNAVNLKKLLIPLPTFSVQLEIVRILDKFTTLEAELEAELDCRKWQYEYYRNQLLSLDVMNGEGQRTNNVTWLTLGEVFETRNGYTPSKANAAFWKNGTIPWFRMEDIRANGGVLKDSIQHVTPQAIKGKGLFMAGSIIMATTATIGEHALITVDALANQRFTNFRVRNSMVDKLLTKFVYYYFFVIDEWCKQNVNVSSFPSVEIERLKKQPFPIPPLAEQQRIVSILDKFEALTTSISEGLPKEIALRRKQYEYYRNQLLSFA